jgi:hypothetical protein
MCNKSVAGPDRQNHIGKHILLSMRKIDEKELLEKVGLPDWYQYHFPNKYPGCRSLSLRILWEIHEKCDIY